MATTAAGRPVAELPGLGRSSVAHEHYVRVGDVLTVETRPVVGSGPAQLLRPLDAAAVLGGKPPALAPATTTGVSASFYINNVEIFRWSNLALLQPFSKGRTAAAAAAAAAADDTDAERALFNLDAVYFAVRLWHGTEVAIVSGDPAQIAGFTTA